MSFTLTAEEGYEIDSVGGTCGGTLLDSTYTTAEITSNCSVVAAFAEIPLASYVVTPTADAGGSISPDTPQTVSEGQNVSFTLIAEEGYEIDSVGGTCGGTLLNSTYTTAEITDNCSVVVQYGEVRSGLPIWLLSVLRDAASREIPKEVPSQSKPRTP